MLDARKVAVLVSAKAGAELRDRTSEIVSASVDGGSLRTRIRYPNSAKEFAYGPERARLCPAGARHDGRMASVYINGELWDSVIDVVEFDTPNGPQRRVFWRQADGEAHHLYPAEQVLVVPSVQSIAGASVLEYLTASARMLPPDGNKPDPTQRLYERGLSAPHNSALAAYLRAADGRLPTSLAENGAPTIAPFRSNLSQRDALQAALKSQISIIEGPPGTGKTETTLNITANLIARGASVAIVSFSNAAVDNVREKLELEGFGFMVATLGSKAKLPAFFDGQDARDRARAAFAAAPTEPVPDDQVFHDLHTKLEDLQRAERDLARLVLDESALQLEQRHFLKRLDSTDTPDLSHLALLRRPASRILSYLVATSQDRESDGALRKLARGIRRYFEYGSTRGVDPRDTATVLELHRHYYERRLHEYATERAALQNQLEQDNLEGLKSQLQQASLAKFRASLRERYASKPKRFSEATYKAHIPQLLAEYPVVLSTCHSLKNNLGGHLVDYLIVDEASQLNLLPAASALGCARNVIVVGDQRQLPHIVAPTIERSPLTPPNPHVDVVKHSLLTSVGALAGGSIPRTLLREHYRCDAQIIGYCNAKFYDGQLLPFKTSDAAAHPLRLWTTQPGSHMRSPGGRAGTNQREVDVVLGEVIPTHFAAHHRDKIGVTTPFRLQVDKFEAADATLEVDTVHKYQGRERDVIIMSTVLDQTTAGAKRLQFVDDPKLINVAVSRAKTNFVLVTEHGKLPASRHLRDLIGYIEYQNPDEPNIESGIVSVFDLLYTEYAAVLEPLVARINRSSEFLSEDIIGTVLADLFAEDTYSDLRAVREVLLGDLVHDPTLLTEAELGFVGRNARVDFVISNRVTHRVVLAVEVDGWAYHENSPEQLARDKVKDAILAKQGVPCVRLRTTDSGEIAKLRAALDAQNASPARSTA